MWDALTGKSVQGRDWLVLQGGALSITKAGWKYIDANNGVPLIKLANIETGNLPEPQLYDLRNDLGEKNNVAAKHPGKVKELKALLDEVISY
jgi:hypothetical protein